MNEQNRIVTGQNESDKRYSLGAVPVSLDILAKAGIGLWAFELDEGKEPRMYVDETMLSLIGLTEQIPPEETYHAWYDHVDKSATGLVAAAVEKMTAGEHAEVQYEWHHPDGRTMTVRCCGVRNFSYEAGVRIEGTHRDMTEMLHLDKEKERNEAQELMLTLMSSLSDVYASLYYIDPETGSYRFFSRNEEYERNIASRLLQGDDFFKDLMANVPMVVFPEDRGKLEFLRSRETMEEAFGTGNVCGVDYRLLINGAPVWYRIKAVKTYDDSTGYRYTLGVININEQKIQQEQLKKNREIIEILASEYSSVYYIDLTTDGLTPYTMNESTESAFGQIFRSGISYSEAYRLYVSEQVLAEDRNRMLRAGSIRNILSELGGKKTFITSYRAVNGHFSEMKFVKVGDEQSRPTAVALGFADKDEELRTKLEAETTRRQNTEIIEILASEYSSVYYIDLTTDSLTPYTMNEETENEFGGIFRSGIRYSEAFCLYVETLVYKNDRAAMLKAGSIFNILRELADKKTFVTTYRSENAGRPHYCEMKFVKVGDDENPRAVALGFADKDEELRAEMERKELAARDAAVISGLSDDFGCVLYVDTKTGKEIHYRTDPLLSAHIPGWGEIPDFGERMKRLGNTLVHPDDREDFLKGILSRQKELIKIVKRDGAYYRNFRLLVDGEIVYYQMKFARDEHSRDHVIVGLRNVDETVRREMEYRENLKAANRSKSDFLFNMSHDIRTPMNAIIGFTQMAKKYIDDKDRVTDSLNKIETSGQHLLELINEVLDMSRVESGKLHSEMKTVDIREAAERLAVICRESAEQKGVDFMLTVKQITHASVLADDLHVNQILLNILGNAVKYTDEGGSVLYSVEETASDREGYGRFLFTIEDTGIGMSKEYQKHIFESFSREDSPSTSRVQGTGLGMAIVKKLVDYMDGSIEIDSEPGRGTKVTVCLYFKPEADSGAQKKKQPEAEVLLKGKRVLLVEDNELNREIAIDILEEQGITVEEAVNGIEAVSKVKANGGGYYDFVLMDIQMPLMNGYEATQKIRKLPDTEALPIIALSANAFDSDKKKALEAGMNAHVSKPIVVRELLEALSAFVEREGE